jgi:hypothetical protein
MAVCAARRAGDPIVIGWSMKRNGCVSLGVSLGAVHTRAPAVFAASADDRLIPACTFI